MALLKMSLRTTNGSDSLRSEVRKDDRMTFVDGKLCETIVLRGVLPDPSKNTWSSPVRKSLRNVNLNSTLLDDETESFLSIPDVSIIEFESEGPGLVYSSLPAARDISVPAADRKVGKVNILYQYSGKGPRPHDFFNVIKITGVERKPAKKV